MGCLLHTGTVTIETVPDSTRPRIYVEHFGFCGPSGRAALIEALTWAHEQLADAIRFEQAKEKETG